MLEFLFSSIPAKAFWFGIISAVSLPIGAVLGIMFKPPKKFVAAIMSFGAGSLIAALTIELVGPAIDHAGYWPMAGGAIIGGILFVALNQIINSQGGFLRKQATTMRHLFKTKKALYKEMIDDISNAEVLRSLPPSEIQMLIPYIVAVEFDADKIIFTQDEIGDSFYLIRKGEIEVIRNQAKIATLSDGDCFGEMSLLSGEPRNATLKTITEVKLWKIQKDDFDSLTHLSPKLLEAVNLVTEQRKAKNINIDFKNRSEWQSEVFKHIDSSSFSYTERDVQEAVKAQTGKNVGLAIFLGILLDGIPESAVIGASMLREKISLALILGLFLANLPEAMSSAVSMKKQGSSTMKIMLMWVFLTIMTGVGALVGNIFFKDASHLVIALFEGCAAGAMLAMVAETMLPEAYEQGGAVVGISTLLGFLATLLIKYVF